MCLYMCVCFFAYLAFSILCISVQGCVLREIRADCWLAPQPDGALLWKTCTPWSIWNCIVLSDLWLQPEKPYYCFRLLESGTNWCYCCHVRGAVYELCCKCSSWLPSSSSLSLSVLQKQGTVAGLSAGAVLLIPEMAEEGRCTNAIAQGN